MRIVWNLAPVSAEQGSECSLLESLLALLSMWPTLFCAVSNLLRITADGQAYLMLTSLPAIRSRRRDVLYRSLLEQTFGGGLNASIVKSNRDN